MPTTVPAPFTMQDVVNDVLTEMRFAPGRDVQIHLQDGIVANASRLYRTLATKYVWRDFQLLNTLTIDGATGKPVELVDTILYRFSDILAIYKDKENNPMPFAPALANPGQFRMPTIVPVGKPTIFAIYPFKAMTVHMYSRIWSDQNFGLDDPVPFYRDILSVGTALQLSIKSGVNKELSASLEKQFDNLLNIYRDQEMKPQYTVQPYSGTVPTEWFVNP